MPEQQPPLFSGRWSLPGGGLEISSPAERVLLARHFGRTHETMLGHIQGAVVQASTRGPITLFVDAEFIDPSTDRGRYRSTEWALTVKGVQLQAVHVLHYSRMVAAGLSLAGLVLGDFLHSYARRNEFERALAAAVRAASAARASAAG